MPHTLEYNYSLPSPTSVPETQVAAARSIPGDALDPWYFNTVAAPMLQQVKTEDEDMVAAPGVRNLFNLGGTRAARTGVPPYNFLDVPGPSSASGSDAAPSLAHLESTCGPLGFSFGGDPDTGIFARDTRGGCYLHEGDGPPGSSSG